jgi:hypothetical protein
MNKKPTAALATVGFSGNLYSGSSLVFPPHGAILTNGGMPAGHQAR